MRTQAELSDPVRLTIVIPVDVHTFNGISAVTAALGYIDTGRRESKEYLEGLRRARTRLEGLRPARARRGQRGYDLISFKVNSPPEAAIFADPAWLAVFIGSIALGVQIVSSYPQLKTGAKEIARDTSQIAQAASRHISYIANGIEGLSHNYAHQLRIGAQLYLESIARLPHDQVERTVARVLRMAKAFGLPRLPIVHAEHSSKHER